MLKKLVNEAHFTLRITATGPLLIRSGRATGSGPDMTPVLTYRNGRSEIFLPGSSLKGVIRSQSEKITCSLRPRIVCYPFFGSEEKEADLEQRRKDYRDSCGKAFSDIAKKSDEERRSLEARTDFVYTYSCPMCRLYGSTSFIGRLSINDAHLVTNQATELRDGVGIDRLTGGAAHGAKFELEVVSTGVAFETEIHLRNFEVWQLGLLFVVLQDMEDELIRIGSGRSRGLGSVKAQISEAERSGQPGGLVVSCIRADEEPLNEVWGLGRWLNDGSYGTWKDDLLTLPRSMGRTRRGIRSQRSFKGDDLKQLRTVAIDEYIKRINNWPDLLIPSSVGSR